MISIVEYFPVKKITSYFGPARVLDLNKERTQALLGLEKGEEKIETWGKIMSSLLQNLSFGDIVLAAGEDVNEIYILGLLKSSVSRTEERLTTADGTYALIMKSNSEEKILINSKNGETIFEYDPAAAKSRINLQPGDIEFTANGNISFISEGNINFISKQFIEMESRHGIRIFLKDVIGKILSSVSLNHRKIKMSSPDFDIISQKAMIHIEDIKYIGNNFSAVIKKVKLVAGKVESITNEIISRAKNVYNDVDELIQLKAGRVRTLVKSTLHIRSKNSYLRSEEDFKVNAEKIHLG